MVSGETKYLTAAISCYLPSAVCIAGDLQPVLPYNPFIPDTTLCLSLNFYTLLREPPFVRLCCLKSCIAPTLVVIDLSDLPAPRNTTRPRISRSLVASVFCTALGTCMCALSAKVQLEETY